MKDKIALQMLLEDKGFSRLLYSLRSNPLCVKLEYRVCSHAADVMRGHRTAVRT